MDKMLEKIGELGIVPVVKIEKADKAAGLAKAMRTGGIPVAEVTFRTAAAKDAITAMRQAEPEMLVGAGTVTSREIAKTAIEAGASFIVSPGWDDGVVDFCLEKGVPVLPGVSGPDGVIKGLSRGLEVLKFFPAEASGGIPMLDALSGPFSSVRFLPTGGIDASNIGAYARKKQILAIGGSWMVKSDLVEKGDWAGIEKLCKEAVLALHGFEFAHMGINEATSEAAAKDADAFASLFGLAPREGTGSYFMSDVIEIMKSPFLGEKGHIAIRCNSVERALAYFRLRGIQPKAETIKADQVPLKSAYLELSVGGFAIHLLRA